MTRVEFPSDYHPLAPIIRQLRASLQWLDRSGVTISAQDVSALLGRFSQLPKSRVKDQRAIQIAQYWQQLPYGYEASIASTHITPSHQNTDYSSQQTTTEPPKLKAKSGPLPTQEFPAVLHQRVVVESISFEQAPPLGTDMEGSAELMTPSQKLSIHKGLIQERTQTVNTDINTAHLSTATHTQSSFFNKPIDANSDDTSLPTAPKAKAEQLWATKPAPQATVATPQASPQKREAFAKLQLKKTPSPKPLAHHTPTSDSASSPNASPLAHVRRTTFEADQMFGEICDRIWACQACPRSSSPHLISSGHYGAQVMFVVANPSELDLKSGHLLMDSQERNLFNGLLRAMSLSRLEIHLTSLMRCGAGEPKPQEWASCQHHFLDELQLVKPKIIVGLGYMASVMLLGDQARQGTWNRYQDIDVMPTFHPKDIIEGGDTTKRKFWNHLKLVMRKAGLHSPTR